jgi:hypothetical protein
MGTRHDVLMPMKMRYCSRVAVIAALCLLAPCMAFALPSDAWVPLNAGYKGGKGVAQCTYLFSLAVDKAGTLYAGGDFYDTTGKEIWGIAKRNGDNWEEVGSGLQGAVDKIVFDKAGTLFAGGNFSLPAPDTAVNLASWDGKSWKAFGGRVQGNVYALAFDSVENLYVGGRFDKIGPDTFNNIACWNGTTWSRLATHAVSPDYGVSGTVYSIACVHGGVEVAGYYTVDCGTTPYGSKHLIQSQSFWDKSGFYYYAGTGCSRRDQTSGLVVQASVYEVEVSRDLSKVWWVGNFSGFDGVTYYGFFGSSGGGLFGSGSGSVLEAVGNNGVFIGGAFLLADPYTRPHVAVNLYYSGSGSADINQFMISSGPNKAASVLAYDSVSNCLYAGGSFDSVGGKYSPLLAKLKLSDIPTGIAENGAPAWAAAPAAAAATVSGNVLRLKGLQPGGCGIEVYSVNGKLLCTSTWRMQTGEVSMALPAAARQLYLCRAKITAGGRCISERYFPVHGTK